MPDQNEKKKHFILKGVTDTEPFSRPPQKVKPVPIPPRDRRSHGTALLGQIEALKLHSKEARELQEEAGLEGGFGLQVEFESVPDIELAFESLARERSGIELLNVRHDEERTYATIFVPDGKLAHFEKLIQEYLEEKRNRNDKVLDHKKLINTIQQIRVASLRALWTDDPDVFPATDDETFWWEVWLPIRDDRSATVTTFRRLAETQGFKIASGELRFPERTVLLVRTSAQNMSNSMMILNSIAELRRAKETAEFFDALSPEEQPEWLDDLLDKCRFPGEEEQVPHVCLLDTGINNGHPLIAKALAASDLHTVEPAWGIHDAQGHGTAMAGLALAGDMTTRLSSDTLVEIGHRLESVKLLPEDGGNIGASRYHGYLTTEAVARPEISNPLRHRVFGMAVTARDNRDRGRPSAFSMVGSGGSSRCRCGR